MVQLSLALEAAVFAPAELCPNGYMYISHRGIALYGGRVLTSSCPCLDVRSCNRAARSRSAP